jgi:hypothetical protein
MHPIVAALVILAAFGAAQYALIAHGAPLFRYVDNLHDWYRIGRLGGYSRVKSFRRARFAARNIHDAKFGPGR